VYDPFHVFFAIFPNFGRRSGAAINRVDIATGKKAPQGYGANQNTKTEECIKSCKPHPDWREWQYNRQLRGAGHTSASRNMAMRRSRSVGAPVEMRAMVTQRKPGSGGDACPFRPMPDNGRSTWVAIWEGNPIFKMESTKIFPAPVAVKARLKRLRSWSERSNGGKEFDHNDVWLRPKQTAGSGLPAHNNRS
jgi:hypothetical protein